MGILCALVVILSVVDTEVAVSCGVHKTPHCRVSETMVVLS